MRAAKRDYARPEFPTDNGRAAVRYKKPFRMSDKGTNIGRRRLRNAELTLIDVKCKKLRLCLRCEQLIPESSNATREDNKRENEFSMAKYIRTRRNTHVRI